jgi:hypothetical protein
MFDVLNVWGEPGHGYWLAIWIRHHLQHVQISLTQSVAVATQSLLEVAELDLILTESPVNL